MAADIIWSKILFYILYLLFFWNNNNKDDFKKRHFFLENDLEKLQTQLQLTKCPDCCLYTTHPPQLTQADQTERLTLNHIIIFDFPRFCQMYSKYSMF